MSIDEESEEVVVIDSLRSVAIVATEDHETVILTVSDPVSIAIVELTQPELSEVIEALTKFVKLR